jgi:hypothetical protein
MNHTGANKALSFKPYLYLLTGLSILLVAIYIAASSPTFVERYYSRRLYSIISFVFHLLLGWIPFSLGDAFYIAIILCLFINVISLIKPAFNRQYRKIGVGLLKAIIGLQIFISAFYLLWGINYSRPPAAKILNLPDSTYTLNQLQSITRLLIDSTNARRSALSSADLTTNNAAIYQTAVKAVEAIEPLHAAFRSFYPAAKSSLFTPLINYMGTAGYFNPFTGESQVNYAMPLMSRPFTACHEMAHQLGFAREDEANFVGFLAGVRSRDRLLQYSAYYLAMQEFMQQVRQRDTAAYHQLRSQISKTVKNDLKIEHLYWQHYQSELGKFVGIFYDGFLKVNRQPEGIRTYNRMVNLTMAYYSGGRKGWAHKP